MFLAVGIVAAILVGIVIGIKLMSEGAVEKAKVQEALIPYFVGVFVLFSAFGIWKLVITAGQEIF